MSVEDVGTIVRLIAVLAIPFMLGVAVGVKIVRRRKEELASLETQLGRDINRIVDSTTEPLRFVGSGVRCIREVTINRNGTKCKITFEAENQ
ncbi:hypothetical protein [Synechococcus phage Yong-M3-232]|nr:hypothetical protein [Synechococcus phage Yong-M3-232]